MANSDETRSRGELRASPRLRVSAWGHVLGFDDEAKRSATGVRITQPYDRIRDFVLDKLNLSEMWTKSAKPCHLGPSALDTCPIARIPSHLHVSSGVTFCWKCTDLLRRGWDSEACRRGGCASLRP